MNPDAMEFPLAPPSDRDMYVFASWGEEPAQSGGGVVTQRRPWPAREDRRGAPGRPVPFESRERVDAAMDGHEHVVAKQPGDDTPAQAGVQKLIAASRVVLCPREAQDYGLRFSQLSTSVVLQRANSMFSPPGGRSPR